VNVDIPGVIGLAWRSNVSEAPAKPLGAEVTLVSVVDRFRKIDGRQKSMRGFHGNRSRCGNRAGVAGRGLRLKQYVQQFQASDAFGYPPLDHVADPVSEDGCPDRRQHR